MLMESARSGLGIKRGSNGQFQPRPCPVDFEAVFVRIGRQACAEHYGANRRAIDRWLDHLGKQRLIAARAEQVRQRYADRKAQLTRLEMEAILKRAVPVDDKREVNFTLARHAAQHLRSIRNGGWIISPTPDGDWWVGSRRRSAAELLDLALAKGFDASTADLSDAGQMRLGCRT